MSEPDPKAKARGTRIQSVARAGQLLLWIAAQSQGATAKEIAKAQSLALPTTYHLLNTLVDEGLLARDSHRRYVLGGSVAILAQAYMRGKAVPEALLGALRELVRRTDETAYLADWGHNEIRVLASVEGGRMVRVAEVSGGPYQYGHARANGKVLLAYAPKKVREAYLRKHPLVPVTANTIVRAAQFGKELEQIRERGYAYDEEEFTLGACCAAAPILLNGHTVSALGLSVPTDRFMENRAELTSALLDVVAGVTTDGAASIDARP
jgi:IclR family acetate operon transcriptional repressor